MVVAVDGRRGRPRLDARIAKILGASGPVPTAVKCSEIDPTCLAGEVINAERRAGLRRLFLYKLTHYPRQTFRLLRRFLRYMPVRDVAYLLLKPFRGARRGPTKAEIVSRAVEHAALKDAAADFTQMPDEVLQRVFRESKAERLRIQAEADDAGGAVVGTSSTGEQRR